MQLEVNLNEEMKFAVLLSIIDLGGGAEKHKVLENLIIKEFIHIAHKGYFNRRSNGETAWQNDLAWERQHLVDLGCIDNSTHGIWRITEKGKMYFIKLFYTRMNNTAYNFLDEPAYLRAKNLINSLNF